MHHPSSRVEIAAEQPLLARLQFIVLGSNFLLKVVILNLAYGIYLLAGDFGTDLFSEDVDGFTFLFAVVVVNVVTYLFYRGIASPANRFAIPGRVDSSINVLVVAVVTAILVASFLWFGQKMLSLSASMALLAIAANSPGLSLASLAVFVAGVPEAIALDEFIPIIFCAILNVFVFLPWLVTKGRRLLIALTVLGFTLLVALAGYYIGFRYNAFKLIERIFEQAAPLSWRGDPLLWFHPHAILGGMPEEREVLVMDGAWDAQFKVTYLIANAPILGTAFLLLFAYALGRFTGRTLQECRAHNSNVLGNFLRLKLLLILIEVMGEKVTDPAKILTYIAAIGAIAAFESVWLGRRSGRRRAVA